MRNIAQIKNDSFPGIPFVSWVRNFELGDEDHLIITVFVLLEVPDGFTYENSEIEDNKYVIKLIKKDYAHEGVQVFSGDFSIEETANKVEIIVVQENVIVNKSVIIENINPYFGDGITTLADNNAAPFVFPIMEGTELSYLHFSMRYPEEASVSSEVISEGFQFNITQTDPYPSGIQSQYFETFTESQLTPFKEQEQVQLSVVMDGVTRKVLVSTKDGTVNTGQ